MKTQMKMASRQVIHRHLVFKIRGRLETDLGVIHINVGSQVGNSQALNLDIPYKEQKREEWSFN